MKILFICSSLEPGKDGVGDYTRKLACTLVKQGHQAMVIALNDKFIKGGVTDTEQEDEGIALRVVRFAHICDWQQRLAKADAYIDLFNPGWISLQYVPYGFNKKGIPFHLPKALKLLSTKARWHIMFHETWIGMSEAAPLMHRLYGYCQKQIVSALVKQLQPGFITTTNLVYQMALQQRKIQAEYLPLFSNISVHQPDEAFVTLLEKTYAVNLRSDDYYRVGIFGTLYPEATLHTVVPAFLRQQKTGRPALLLTFGKNSRPDELEKLKLQLPADVTIIELGALSPSHLSTIFNLLHEAVLCTPEEYIGKSGAYAALRLHQVKVAILSSAPIPGFKDAILKFNEELEKKETYKWSVDYVTKEFINVLGW